MARRALMFCMAALLLGFVATRSISDSVRIDLQLPRPFLENPSNVYTSSATSARRTIQQLTMPGFASQASSGNPALPCKTIYAALPPNADENTLELAIEDEQIEEMPGQYDVLPVPAVLTCDAKDISIRTKSAAYTTNSYYPSDHAIIKSTGYLRTWKIVEIQLWPCKYNPVSGSIQVLKFGSICLKYQTQPKTPIVSDPIAAEMGSFVGNIAQARSFYSADQPNAMAQSPGYAIITTSAIAASSAKLAAFAAHQESRGFKSSVITETAWGGGVGDTAANNIRNWLKTNYLRLGLRYLLIIGDPNPSTSAAPMKLLWPRRNQTDYREAVSDYFYADLTGNWDRDGDNYYGEYPDDFGEGGIDRIPELYVGRIPFYGDVSALDSILQKTISYESDRPGKWSRNCLLPMKPLDTNTPSYQLGEEISADIAIPAQMTPRRAYDSAYGLNPSPECIPCDYAHVLSEWQTNGAGIVLWMTHGSAYLASGVLTSQNTMSLDDSRPAIVFCASCDNGYPESSSNLGYALLKNGAVCTQSASRVAWYYPGSTFKGSDSIGGMGYEYAKRLIMNGESCGQAAYESRVSLPLTIWMNHLVFNIYGDPSLNLQRLALGGITGKVTDTSGNPISGAAVRTADGSKEAHTDSNGSYSLALGDTIADMIISAADYYTQKYYKLLSSDGALQTLDIQLVHFNYGSINGHIRDEFGAAIPAAAINLIGTPHNTTSAADGKYSIDQVEPGVYSIIVSKAGYAENMAANFTVEEFQSATINVTLRAAAGNLVKNGDFEGIFTPNLATGWSGYSIPNAYGSFQNGFDQSYDGQFAQKLTLPQSTSAPSRLGIFQIINTQPGQTYQLSAWQRDYFSGQESDASENVICRIGVDLAGGASPSNTNIIWQDFAPEHMSWNHLSSNITASTASTTVLLEAVRTKTSGGNYCFAWFDAVSLVGSVNVPPVPRVKLSARYIRPDEPITVSWNAGAPTDHYEYAVATSANPASMIPDKAWSSAGAATSSTISGLNLHNGDLLYVSLRATSPEGIHSENGVSEGLRVIYDVGSIQEAKLMPDGTWVRLPKLLLSRMVSEQECYLQNDIAAIKIWGKPNAIPYMAPGTAATAVGCLNTNLDVRELCEAEVMPSTVKIAPRPLGMTNSAVAGGDFNSNVRESTSGQKGSLWGRGLNNVALLVKVWGRVISMTDQSFVLNDGSIASGLRITCANSAKPPKNGSYVSVIGISTPHGVIACSEDDITELQ